MHSFAQLTIFFLFLRHTTARRWAYFEKFNGKPRSPSQALLPTSTHDFVVTHRTHPASHFTTEFPLFFADHDERCRGPDPALPLRSRQHIVRTTQVGRGYDPDKAFYICGDHLMSALGHVSPYSIATFFPKQEWDFSNGGILEFEVTNSALRPRNWFEVLVSPRNVTSVAAGPEWAPIEEHYPHERMVFQYVFGFREMQVGAGAQDPEGRLARFDENEAGRVPWYLRYPNDLSMRDRRARIKHRIVVSRNLRRVTWSTQTPDNRWDTIQMRLRGRMSFTRGMVLFKTHSYLTGDNPNFDDVTDHWDNLRFSGPVVGKYVNYEAEDVIYMQRNGDSFVGNNQTNTIRVDKVGRNPILFGQVHQPVKGEILLSVNGAPNIEVRPYTYTDDCAAYGWKSFQLPVSRRLLRRGINEFRWSIGRRICVGEQQQWIGYSIKSLELQFDV